MRLHALAIFGSALLLFLLQLITAKRILPWFGGSAAVWVTCLVFFQVLLLLGYTYADWSIRRLSPKRHALLHAALLIASLALLPVAPDAAWKLGEAANPTWRILGLLTVTIGLPFFLLSTTTPLIQAWLARGTPGANPYRLFALSNLAALLALLAYPAAIEPWLTTTVQTRIWSLAYAGFVALCVVLAWQGLRSAAISAPAVSPGVAPEQGDAPPAPGVQLLWGALAATASILLLAVSNHLSQNIAAAPLLWVVPLSIYLLSFILCFDSRGWYRRDLFLALLALALGALAWRPESAGSISRPVFQIILFSGGLFIASMFCHGELSRLRPSPRHLTRFYLLISLGGALGALLVGIVAPLIFPGFYELEIGLVALAALGLYQVRDRKPAIVGIAGLVLLASVGSAGYRISTYTDGAVLAARNFYGVLRVKEERDQLNPERDRRVLFNGSITHGDQSVHPRFRRALGTYYRTTSGIGRTLVALVDQPARLRVGVIGLGVGTIAAYGRPGDDYRFYEINPAVAQVARREFTYLKYSAASTEVVLGDARIELEREASQQFDVLAVDAFSGDAIPVHLLTREALEVYLRHIKPGGIIAFHVSSAFLNLVPVIQGLASSHGLYAAFIADRAPDNGGFDSDWVLLTTDRGFLDRPEIAAAASPFATRSGGATWTDDFSNLLRVLK